MSQADKSALSLLSGEGEKTHCQAHSDSHKASPSFPEFINLLTFRYCLFLFMEAGFVCLAWYCYQHPRQLPDLNFEDTTVKSGFTAIFTLWHTIAIASALTICADAFSREWAARLNDRIDAVSTITSGVVDRLYYSFRSRATKTFRTAFLAFLGLLIVRTIGSSTITVTSGVPFERQLPIGLISTPSLTSNSTDPTDEDFTMGLRQAGMIARLERMMGSPWGYVPQPNWLIPLPTEDLKLATSVAYQTDLVAFNHTCQWQAPTFLSRNTTSLNGQSWEGAFFTNASALIKDPSRSRNGSSILKLSPSSKSNYTGFSVYLFLGGNSSVPLNSSNPDGAWLDLSDLPTTLNPDGFATFYRPLPSVDWVRAPLATLLVCDPQLRFTSGNVLLNPVSNLTAPDMKILSTGDVVSPGNIDPQAARTLFTSALTFAAGLPDSSTSLRGIEYLNINTVTARMFLVPPQNLNWNNASAVRPLDMESINRQVDDFTLSALKAFTSGYKSEVLHYVNGTYVTYVTAKYTSSGLALATSGQFVIVVSALFCVLAFTLALLAYLNVTQQRSPFNLGCVKKVELGSRVEGSG